MRTTYYDLIYQSYYFPQQGFDLKKGYLYFHDISLKYLIDKYGTPLRIFYLPHIGVQIRRAKNLFQRAFKKHHYSGKYYYAYCTKSNHFFPVLKEVLQHDTHIETSSSYDIDLILKLYEKGLLSQDRYIIHNGTKTQEYLQKILYINDLGFKNSIIVLDSINELDRLEQLIQKRKIKIGLRAAIHQESQFAFYTSRLGIPAKKIVQFYKDRIRKNPQLELKMFHFFVESGIRDVIYYWEQLQNAIKLYVELSKISDTLDSFNIGGGFPIRNSLDFEYDYEYMINEIVLNIKEACVNENIREPNIFSEFGRYTVGESGALIFEVFEQKQQNDTEIWYIINNSLMTTMPDIWSLKERFILLPINKWDNEYARVNIGGITCDRLDYYTQEEISQEVILPKFSPGDKEPLYIGFFHNGAYQDAISGYGGIKHCLIPQPKHIIIDRDDSGNLVEHVFKQTQSADEVLKILGY